MAEVNLEHVAKTFTPEIHALDDISLTVKSGECLAIVGSSGCGKTTLLRIIAGLDRPTSGILDIAGQRVNHVPPNRRDVAMLFQRPALIPNQTVRQNLGWAWSLRDSWFRVRRIPDRDAKLQRMAGALGLENELDRSVHELSGGQQQRVALGRCLLREAKVCLLDEPLGHLDAPLRAELRREIRALARECGATLLFVTHDPDEALAAGDRIAVMQQGRIVQIDEPARLRQRPANRYVTELLHYSRGGMNCVAGDLRVDLDRWWFEGPFGSWSGRRPDLPWAKDFPRAEKKLLSHKGGIHIIIAIAAERVRCGAEEPTSDEVVELTLPMAGQEVLANGVFVVGRQGQGQRWIGRADRVQGWLAGQKITMTFSIRQTFGFDFATGRTLWAPAG